MMSIEGKSPTSELIEHYSDWNSLKKSCSLDPEMEKIALGDQSLKEWAINLKVTINTNRTLEDMDKAEMAILAFEQRQHFA